MDQIDLAYYADKSLQYLATFGACALTVVGISHLLTENDTQNIATITLTPFFGAGAALGIVGWPAELTVAYRDVRRAERCLANQDYARAEKFANDARFHGSGSISARADEILLEIAKAQAAK